MPDQLCLPCCVLPGCGTPVALVGDACGGCREAFGDMLRHDPAGTRMTQEQIDARDAAVHAAYRQQRSVS